MVFWSAAIGIRRFQQGILIRHGQTRRVGFGTAIRLASSGGTGIVLAIVTSLPGVYIASIGLMAGVTSEMLFILFAVRPTMRWIRENKPYDSSDRISFWDAARYHTPLAATSLLTLLAQPVISAGLARMPYPEANLAAWPVVWGILFLFRSPAFALPEAVIALTGSNQLNRFLKSFCRRVGIVSSTAMAVFSVTPLLGIYLRYGAGLPERLSRFVVPGLLMSIALPFINSIHSWMRGQLMAARRTRVIYWGMGLNLMLIAALMAAGVFIQANGSGTAAIALIASFGAELFYLGSRLPPGGSAPGVP
jgi:progressive ankylosis protein